MRMVRGGRGVDATAEGPLFLSPFEECGVDDRATFPFEREESRKELADASTGLDLVCPRLSINDPAGKADELRGLCVEIPPGATGSLAIAGWRSGFPRVRIISLPIDLFVPEILVSFDPLR